MGDAAQAALVFGLTVVVTAGLTGVALRPLRRLAVSRHLREDIPETHLEKVGTPSMGGVPMLVSISVLAVAAGAVTGTLSVRVGFCLGVMLLYALIGLADDARKLGDKRSRGIPARYRIAAEAFLAAVFVGAVLPHGPDQAGLAPWLGTATWPGGLAVAAGIFVLVGGANAVNLTDGLDGLASGLTAICALCLAVVLFALGEADLALLATVVAGGAAGFLVLNAKPARVWMGDVGSLGLGAALAAVAVSARLEVLFALVAAVFVAETLSVILQVISFKSTGKRIFRMSPLHHHFELGGHSEQRVVLGFWVAGVVAAVAGLGLVWISLPSVM